METDDNTMTPSPEQIEEYCQKLIAKFKQEPNWELQQEFGRMLMRHIDSFTEEERNRYDELKRILEH
jgi:replication fork clamp-binding protein CrfC